MSLRFSIHGQIYDFVHASQSGQIIHQKRVQFTPLNPVDQFVDLVLKHNEQLTSELVGFLGLVNNESPREPLIAALRKGDVRAQKGSLAHIGGPARAPKGPPKPAAKPKPRPAPQPEVVTLTPSKKPELAEPEPQYKISVEVAGRARCGKQRLEISGESVTPSFRPDNRNPHRSVIEFSNLLNEPRDITLVIPTSGAVSDIRLPLATGVAPADKNADKSEWDNVLVPVKPLAYINDQRNRQQADVLSPGFVYVFWKGKLWRELEAGRNQVLRDVNVEFHRANWNGDLGQQLKRESEGHWVSDIWLPYKIQGEDQSSQLQLVYSKAQLDMPYIENLENDAGKLAGLATSAAQLSQYSAAQTFVSDSGDIGDVATALQDQHIDPESGYSVLSEKGRHFNRARQDKIPVAYLNPIGEQFVLQVETDKGPLANKPFTLNTDNGTFEGKTDGKGMLEIPLQEAFGNGEITLWQNANKQGPTYVIPFEAKPDHVEAVTTVKGQQARLNNLGFQAGPTDGVAGRLTEAAARRFQQQAQLEVDGIIGPKTQKKLQQQYGQ